MQRKQIVFDLDTKALKEYYPGKHWRNAYNDISKYMRSMSFEWTEGSVYESRHGLTYKGVEQLLEDLIEKYPWLNVCMRDCRQTNIGKSHAMNHLFDKSIEIPRRDKVKEEEFEF